MRDHSGQTVDWFRAALFGTDPVELTPSPMWTDDDWYLDQDAREVLPGEGWWPLRPGTAEGRVVGGNLGTLNLLPSTGYLPGLDDAVLIVEDDAESHPARFART
jgi:muramoyltetrapeptide carboxypeptidase LdcA involved in peptidoglycan recycling